MSDPGKAVFLSYASQDAEAAKKICDALRGGGVEVWFDADGGLEHGDEWDAKIRRQIKECVLFIPIISATTQARHEGYFRIEWDLAAERARGIASGVPFILPVVIDGTREPDALVPDRFRTVQWTRLPGGVVPPDVQARFLKLWSHRTGVLAHEAERAREPSTANVSAPVPRRMSYVLLAAIGVAAIALGSWWWLRRADAPAPPPEPAATAAKAVAVRSPAGPLADRARELSAKAGFTREDLNLADDFARRAIEADATYAPAWGVRAYVNAAFLMRGFAVGDDAHQRASDAEKYANRARAMQPDDVDALLALGMVQVSQGGGEPEALYRRALALAPADNRPRLRLSTLLRYQRRYSEAIAVASEAVRVAPGDGLAHYELAMGYRNAQDFPAAQREVNATLAVGPFDSAYLLKAGFAYREGDFVSLHQALDALSPEARSQDRAVFVAMRAALIEHRPDAVISAAALNTREYLEDSSFTGPKVWFVALAQRMAGHETLARLAWQSAETLLRKRLQADPGSLRDQCELAITLAWLGRRDEAASIMAPVESAYREQQISNRARPLAYFYSGMGEAGKAIAYLKESRGLSLGWTEDADTAVTLALDPWWDPIRNQPEFVALLEELKRQDEKSAGLPGPVSEQKHEGPPEQRAAVLK